MKKIFFILFVSFLFFSCSSGKKDNIYEKNDSFSIEDNYDNEIDVVENDSISQDDSLDLNDNDVALEDENDLSENETEETQDFEESDENNPDEISDEDLVVGNSISWNSYTTTVKVSGNSTLDKTYELSTDNPLRDNAPQTIKVHENKGEIRIRTGNTIFDALFALAMQEAHENIVHEITDGAFNDGKPVPCDCFETGEKWHYVWTRDTAFSTALSLGMLFPEIAKRSIEFKISNKKDAVGGDNPEFVQDTGSGGSWPVSTDRISLAIGGYSVLNFLADKTSKAEFEEKFFTALKNTVETDRTTIFHQNTGLYGGETSFLDWREQTYPLWTAKNTVHIGMSESLSTNLLHYEALKILSNLADIKGFSADSIKYNKWASNLKDAINSSFWIEEKGMYSSFRTTFLDNSAVTKFDLLGNSLAILFDVASDNRAKSIVQNYPSTLAGFPVIWPQNQEVPIYHNRAIWPFVTAFFIESAKKIENSEAVYKGMLSLIRGPAFNLSNMENFEFTTLSANFKENSQVYPVVDSKRQLWSVAGYLSMVIKTLFGIYFTQQGLVVNPIVPKKLIDDFFPGITHITLDNLKYKDKIFTVVINLPQDEKAYTMLLPKEIRNNGQTMEKGYIPYDEMESANNIYVEMYKDNTQTTSTLIKVPTIFNSYSPKAPNDVVLTKNGNNIDIAWHSSDNGVVFDVYKNGKLIKKGVSKRKWTDTNVGSQTPCYSIEAMFTNSLNYSFHSNPVCFWGNSNDKITEFFANQISGKTPVNTHGKLNFEDWGKPNEELSLEFSPSTSGIYLVQLNYGNGRPINTGITDASKLIEIKEKSTDFIVGTKMVFMPHLGENDWNRWGNSSFASFDLDSSKTYVVTIKDNFNMSYFQHFKLYTAGAGGGDDVYNRINLSSVKFLQIK